MRSPLNFLGNTAAVWLLRKLIRELQGIRKAQEAQVDTLRQAYGLPPIYSAPPEIEEPPLTVERDPIGDDYLKVWLVEQLAYENRIPLGSATDLSALALERAWMTPEGQFLVLPKAIYQVDPSERARLGL